MSRTGVYTCAYDKGSTNGTLVAGRRLDPNEAVDLGIGDMVTLGSTGLVL